MVATAKFLVEATKNSFVVPNFVAVTKPFFSVNLCWRPSLAPQDRRKLIPQNRLRSLRENQQVAVEASFANENDKREVTATVPFRFPRC